MARVASVDAPKLRQLLREQLEQRVAPDGWSVVESDPAVLVTFARPFDDAFSAIAEVLAALGVPDRPPVEITNVVVGVSYEPLLRLYAELGEDWGRSALEDPVTVGDPPRSRISISLNGKGGSDLDPNSPIFQKAQKTCQPLTRVGLPTSKSAP